MAKLTKGYFEGTGGGGEVRVNKYLSDAGVCSRREADELVAAGKVLIDGKPAVMGSKILPGQKVVLDGRELTKDERMVLIAFNKPQGIVCTTDRREPDNIIDFINYGSRIFPIGRLDKDSEGLILLTNDGEIVNKILRAGNGHEKEYIVQVNKPLTPEFLKGMAGGVPVLDTVTKPCLVEQLDKMTFRIVLTQGLNRQIRRMCEYFDYRVRSLQRVRVMNINLGRLKTGTYRNLTDWELEELNRLIADSSNAPASAVDAVESGDMPPEGIAIVKTIERRPVKKRSFDGKAPAFGEESARPKLRIKGEGWTKKKEDARGIRGRKESIRPWGEKKDFRGSGERKENSYPEREKKDFRVGKERKEGMRPEGEKKDFRGGRERREGLRPEGEKKDFRGGRERREGLRPEGEKKDFRGIRERKEGSRPEGEKKDFRGIRERKEGYRPEGEKKDFRGIRERKEGYRPEGEKKDIRGIRERKEGLRPEREKKDFRGSRERKESFRSGEAKENSRERKQKQGFPAGSQKKSFPDGSGRKPFPAGQRTGRSRIKK